ncbi:MAG: hypothetical protein KatS3mg122_2998 [Caldimonas sp.]|nr:MAG: hypothetical protein KatS3mg122_2998 [Caldimonas sp.]
MITESTSQDIVYSNLFTGVHGNYLRGSIVRAGLDPDHSAAERPEQDELRRRRGEKAWKDIWGAGQGVGAIKEVVPARVFIERLRGEYLAAKAQLCAA